MASSVREFAASSHSQPSIMTRCFRAVLADGKFPGPLIKGNKVVSKTATVTFMAQPVVFLGR